MSYFKSDVNKNENRKRFKSISLGPKIENKNFFTTKMRPWKPKFCLKFGKSVWKFYGRFFASRNFVYFVWDKKIFFDFL